MTSSGLGGGVQGHSGRRMRTGPLLLLSRGQLWFGKQFDGACYSSFRGVSHSIFQTPHSHAEKSWHFWQSIIVSLFLRWCCGLFISDFTSLSERLLLCLESSTTTACKIRKKKLEHQSISLRLTFHSSNWTLHAMTLTNTRWSSVIRIRTGR